MIDGEVLAILRADGIEEKGRVFPVLLGLLGYLRSHTSDFFLNNGGYRLEIEAETTGLISNLQAFLRTTVYTDAGKWHEGHFHEDEIKEFWSSETGEDEMVSVLQARVFALAIHDQYQTLFWERLCEYYRKREPQSDGTFALGPNDPIPACAPPFSAGSTVIETKPRRLPRWRMPDRTDTIMLAPVLPEALKVSINLSFESELKGLSFQPQDGTPLTGDDERQAGLRIATIHPFAGMADIEPKLELKERRFGPVTPKNIRKTKQRLLEGLEVAAQHRAHIVIIPELCVTEPILAALKKKWSQLVQSHRSLQILVAGSHHTDGPKDMLKNVAYVFGRDDNAENGAVIQKNVPYIYRHPVPTPKQNKADVTPDVNVPKRKTELVERIKYASEPRLQIFYSREGSMAVLICVDFLHDLLRDSLRDLDVSLVVIPSMSEKIRIFERLTVGHVAATQSVVIIANAFIAGADEGDPEEPKLSRGYIRRSGKPERWRIGEDFEGSLDCPGTAIVDLYDPNATWIPSTN